jgi:predicted PurR-regulated permease PerM
MVQEITYFNMSVFLFVSLKDWRRKQETVEMAIKSLLKEQVRRFVEVEGEALNNYIAANFRGGNFFKF